MLATGMLRRGFGVVVCAALLTGCGQGSSPTENAGGDPAAPPPAALKTNSGTAAEADDGPAPGTPEYALREAILLRAKPLPPSNDATTQAVARRSRNEEIIKLSTEVISKTHDSQEKEEVFVLAVHQLLESRFQLALGGSQVETDALYDDAQTVMDRNPKSKAAAEAAYTLARFAHINARNHGKNDPRWLEVFSRQSRLFAENFPEEEVRAVPLLFAAGWSCELHKLNDEAVNCYTLLAQKFPKTPQAQQVTAMARRLNLKGQPLQFAGPTLDGGFVNIDDYKGQTVLVVFWATDSARFQEILPQLSSIATKYEKAKLTVLGVNLDEEENKLDEFLVKHRVNWPQIFHTDADKRRWDNPIVKYYGVRDIPQMWLVDAQGKVVDTAIEINDLDKAVAAALSNRNRIASKPVDGGE